jgi:hypothetical protein
MTREEIEKQLDKLTAKYVEIHELRDSVGCRSFQQDWQDFSGLPNRPISDWEH